MSDKQRLEFDAPPAASFDFGAAVPAVSTAGPDREDFGDDEDTGEASRDGDPEPPLTIYLVKQLELVVRALMDDALRPQGLTTLQYTALSVLRRRGKLSSAQLARRSFVTPQSMHEMILGLERSGLVVRERDHTNRRVLLIELTPRGRQLVKECTPLVREFEHRALESMSEGERFLFRDCLRRGYASLAPLVGRGPDPDDASARS
jgi:DNA-binding MarR family transcriptional regulator